MSQQVAARIASDEEGDSIRTTEGPRTRWLAAAAVVAASLALCVLAVFELESTTRAWDAHAQAQSAARIVELGDSFYVSGTDQKGPLWLAFYVLAYRLGGLSGMWSVVAALAIGVAVATGWAIWRGAKALGDGPISAAVVATASVLHLLFGPEEYSRVLYSRNIVGALFAAAFALVLAAPRRRLTPLLIAGGLAGLAVQTNLGSAPTGLVLAGVVAFRDLRDADAEDSQGLRLPLDTVAFGAAALVVLVSAPLWYALRGDFRDFWDQWWTYNTYYANGTGRSLADVLAKGVQDFVAYYRAPERWYLLLVVVLFAADAVRRLRRQQPVRADVALLAWWVAECVAVALAQRFFAHYLVLPFVPIAFMAAVLAARWAPRGRPVARRVALGALTLAVAVSVSPRLSHAVERATAPDVAYVPADPPDLRTVVHANSPPGSYVYIWLTNPEAYTHLDRRSPTRYIESRWLTGTIYGAVAPRAAWVLPHTYENWRSDLLRTPPRLWVEVPDPGPVPPGSPMAVLRDCAFEEIWASGGVRVLGPKRPVAACLDD